MTDTSMDYYEVLKENLYLFSKYLVAEDFLDLLIKDNVLSLDDKELITNRFIHQTRRQRATKFIEILMLRGQHGYNIFIEYTEYLYPHVFTMVTGKEPRIPPPYLKRNRESDKLRLINELPNLAQQIKEQWYVNTELDTELTVLQHILEYAKEENMALEKEIEGLKETRFENETLKVQIVKLEREKNEQHGQMNKEMLRTFDYIKERDELQDKYRASQVKHDELYKKYREVVDKTPSKQDTEATPDVRIKPPLPERNRPDEQKIAAHMDVAKKILMDELEDYKEKCEELAEKLHAKCMEIEYLEVDVGKKEKELNKTLKERNILQKHLNESNIKCESYFKIIQKKDSELLENNVEKRKEEKRLQDLMKSKNELFETSHRLEQQVKDLQCELDRIKARQSSSSVDIDNSSSFSASEEDSGDNKEFPKTRKPREFHITRKPRRRPIIKKKASREGRLSSRHAVFGGDAFNNIDDLTPAYGDSAEVNLPDYYKASTMPAAVNETAEMVFRRECAMFRYTMKSKGKFKEKSDYVSSMNVEPSNSIKRCSDRSGEDIVPSALRTLKKEAAIHPNDVMDKVEDSKDNSSTSTGLVPRSPNGRTGEHPSLPPKPPHLHKLAKEKTTNRNSPSQSEEEEGSGSVTDNSNRSSTATNESNDSSLSSDFPCWEVSTHFLPKDCVRVNRPGLPDKHMCREVVLKYPVIDDKIIIKGGNHTGIYIYRVLKASNISEGEEIKGIMYVPSMRNEEITTSLDGCTLEETCKLLSEEYISWKKEKEVKLKLKNCCQEYDSARKWMKKNDETGDYIFIRCNMDVDGKSPNEIKLKNGDIYLITNTMFEQHKWLGKKIDDLTGKLDTQEEVLPNLQQANLRRFPSTSDKRRGVVKLRGQCYDRVLPMTATIKLPVHIMGPEMIVQALIGLLTTDVPSMFVRKYNDPVHRSSEPLMHDVHYVTGGLLDNKSQSKSHSRIYLFINISSPLSDNTYKSLFGGEFEPNSADDPVSMSARIKQHISSSSVNYKEIDLNSIQSRDALITMVRQSVEALQKKMIWLSAEEMDESVAKKYVKYLGQDLGQLMHRVHRANSIDQS